MFQDFNELLSIFNAHSVKYLVVGGYAVSEDADEGRTIPIDEVRKMIPKWISKFESQKPR